MTWPPSPLQISGSQVLPSTKMAKKGPRQWQWPKATREVQTPGSQGSITFNNILYYIYNYSYYYIKYIKHYKTVFRSFSTCSHGFPCFPPVMMATMFSYRVIHSQTPNRTSRIGISSRPRTSHDKLRQRAWPALIESQYVSICLNGLIVG